jgi:hypothetical protein
MAFQVCPQHFEEIDGVSISSKVGTEFTCPASIT